MNRREFIELLIQGSVATGLAGYAGSAASATRSIYDMESYGQARLLHITDTHAQLLPIHFREPSVNLGLGDAYGKWPHRVGKNLLSELSDLTPRQIHAFTYLDFTEAAENYGRVGGFAHLATLVKQLRGQVADGASLLLDGGDTWQGSGTALWTRGQDMVGATNLLGVDVMTGHWEFTYLEEEVLANAAAFSGDFVAQNTRASEDALFEGVPVFDEDSGHVFPPYVMKVLNGRRVAVIGQAFPYTPIANPQRFIPNWTFGIQEADLALERLAGRVPPKIDAVRELMDRLPGSELIGGGL